MASFFVPTVHTCIRISSVHVYNAYVYLEHADVLYSKRDHGLRDTIILVTQVSGLAGRHTDMFNLHVINDREGEKEGRNM